MLSGRSADGARRRHPVRPVPAQHVRGHADQFATDHLALAIAKAAIDEDFDEQLEAKERGFLYMPFQHSENLADQNRSMLLFTELGDASQLDYARKHHDDHRALRPFPASQCDPRPRTAPRRDRGGRRNAVLEQVRDRAGVEAGLRQALLDLFARYALPRAGRARRPAPSACRTGRRRASCRPRPDANASCIASTSAGPMPRMIGTKR